MLAVLGWRRLEDRQKDLGLALLYKIVHGHVAVPVDALNLEPRDPRTRKNHNFTYKDLTPPPSPPHPPLSTPLRFKKKLESLAARRQPMEGPEQATKCSIYFINIKRNIF